MKFLALLFLGFIQFIPHAIGQNGDFDKEDRAVNFYDEHYSTADQKRKIVTSQKVKLVGFEAMPMITGSNQKKVAIKWKTALERNNSHYTLQRSSDGVKFEDVRKIDGTGNCSEDFYYELFDENPFSDRTYYRLKQISFDGKEAYSNVVSSQFKKMQGIIVYNNNRINPNGVNIIVDSDISSIAEVKIMSKLGKQKFLEQIELKKGMNDVPLNTSKIPKGDYHVVVSINDNLYTGNYKKTK